MADAWTAAPDPDLSRDPFDVWACPREDAHGPHRWRLKQAKHLDGFASLTFVYEYHCPGRRPVPAQPPGHDPWCRSLDPLWADYPVCDCRLAVIAAAHDDGHEPDEDLCDCDFCAGPGNCPYYDAKENR